MAQQVVVIEPDYFSVEVTAPQTVTISNTGPQGATGPTGPEGGTSTLTTKGDLLGRSATAIARIPVGADGQMLTADSTNALGVAWTTPNPGDITAVNVTSPITGGGTSGSVTVGIDQTLLSITQSQVTNLTTDLAAKAPLASPALSGTPTAPTAAVDTNTTQIATTGYVVGQGYLKSATASSTYAPLASPALTGNPTAPTASVDDNDTSIATTAFVVGQAGTATPLVDGTAAAGTSLRYSRQDHVHPTDTTRATALDEVIPTDPTGAYFTGSGFRLYNTLNNLATTPDAAVLDITGDIDIRVKVAMTDWTPSGLYQGFVEKWGAAGTRSYGFGLGGTLDTGKLIFSWTTDGTNEIAKTSSVVTGLTDGSTKWVRVTLDVDNGASGNDVKFFTSDDGTTWTQLGTTVTTAGVTSIFSGSSALGIGRYAATYSMDGTIYRAQILNGIGGTTVFDANFETVPADSFAFSESSSNAATVTLTTTRYSFGLPGVNIYTPSTNAPSANQTLYTPFKVIGKTITVKHVAFEATAVPASTATVRIAVFAADANMQPTGAAVYDSGAISVSTAAAAIYRIRVSPFNLSSGNYLIAYNTNVQFTNRTWISANVFTSNTLGASFPFVYQVTETLSGSYPNPPTKWNTRSSNAPGIWNRVVLGWS